MSVIENTLYRIEMIRRQIEKIEQVRQRISAPLLDFSDVGEASVALRNTDKSVMKAKALSTLTKVEAEADKLTGLGGTLDEAWLTNHKPTEILALLMDYRTQLMESLAGGVMALKNGEYERTLSADELAGLKDASATLGVGLKTYAGWLRPQIEVL